MFYKLLHGIIVLEIDKILFFGYDENLKIYISGMYTKSAINGFMTYGILFYVRVCMLCILVLRMHQSSIS